MKKDGIKKKRLPIAWRLTISNTVVLFLLLVLFTLALIGLFLYEISETKESRLQNAMGNLESRLTGQKELSKDFLKTIKLKNDLNYSLFDSTGKLLFSSEEVAAPELRPMSLNIRFLGENQTEKGESEENEYIVESGKWIGVNGQNTFLYVFGDITEEMEIIEGIPYVLAATIFLGLVISFFAGRFLSKNMLKPVKNISSRMKNISANNLSERMPETAAEDELEELTQSFNMMIERLEQSFALQKRFVSDASHELRTPLAVMQGHTSMLLRWGREDREVLESSLKTMHAEIRSMTELVERLLSLAKNDDSSLDLRKEKIAAGELLREVIDEARLVSPESDIQTGACDAGHVYADRSALKQVLRNLLENSVKFCPPPGKIVLQAARRSGGTEITVADEGVGIESEKLPFVFDRFFREDSSRTKKTGGTGLGLAIAKSIIESHGGRIDVKSQRGKGTQIRVWLPDD